MKFIRVNMSNKTIAVEDVPQNYLGLGGRGLTSIVINAEVPPKCDPLGPKNKLVLAPGLLSGTPLVNTSRISIGAKSPLTGTIKESNAGGTVAAALGHLGITAVIIEGRAADGELSFLRIDRQGAASLVPAQAYRGARTYALVKKILEDYGEKTSVLCIGPAGEYQLAAASIQTSDIDGRPCRAAGRGGLGAVMGAKGLKAIIVDQGGQSADPIADPEAFKAANKVIVKVIKEHPMAGIDDLDTIARLDYLCDDIGMDTMSAGVAMAVAMDADYKEFGDRTAAIEMIEEIGKGTQFGKILGNGPAAVGKHFNHDRVPVVKGQSIAAYDPRAMLGNGVTFATSPMGADHTAGNVVGEYLEQKLDPLNAAGQVEASRNLQIATAAADCTGLCFMAHVALTTPEGGGALLQAINAKFGIQLGPADVPALGLRVLKAEREFNRKAGFNNQDDRLPKFFYEESLPPHNTVFTISDAEVDRTFDF